MGVQVPVRTALVTFNLTFLEVIRDIQVPIFDSVTTS